MKLGQTCVSLLGLVHLNKLFGDRGRSTALEVFILP